ncbi:hypothetical protein ACH5RR_041448 [Cinchona calisaya]|uniref:Uncharacterized protein n=1 Tax=Cinchona calisaya TaxID=153742 RepID=A0ABD2XW64_9GENT
MNSPIFEKNGAPPPQKQWKSISKFWLLWKENKGPLKFKSSLINFSFKTFQSKLVMFMQSHWMMLLLPIIAKKGCEGPKAEETVGMKQYQRCLIVIWQQRVTDFAASRTCIYTSVDQLFINLEKNMKFCLGKKVVYI